MTTMYLIWSNKQNAWWGPNGGNYTPDIWEAGRFTLEDAEQRCNIRTWEPGKVPPEVAVAAPETYLTLDTYEEIEAVPAFVRGVVEEITACAMRERRTLAGTR